MKKKDAKQVKQLLADFLKTKKVYFSFSNAEVEHFFTPKDGVMYSYVIEEDTGKPQKEIVDFFSFYSLPSSVLKSTKHTHIKAVFSYYNTSHKYTPTQIMENSVIQAKK